jgi:hypothetical protein
MLCGFLIGCDQAALIKKFTPPEDESFARSYVDSLRQGKFDEITRNLDPSVANLNIQGKLAEMAALIPAENPMSVKVVGVNLSRTKEYRTTTITLEYQFPSKWLLVEVVTQRGGRAFSVVGFHVTPISDSVENLNRFTLVGKSFVQYSILILAISSFGFSLYVLILCIRTKGVKRKWLWMIFILVGVEKVAVNWGTGQLTFGVLAINIPCAIAGFTPYGPWTIGVLVPIGAILFFDRQRRRKTASELISPTPQT